VQAALICVSMCECGWVGRWVEHGLSLHVVLERCDYQLLERNVDHHARHEAKENGIPAGALRRIERLVPQNFHRMSEEDQAVIAVRIARGIQHVERVFGSDARLDNALRTRLADVLHRVAPAIAPSVIIPDDLRFAPDISDSE
jgi:hypothetical protein